MFSTREILSRFYLLNIITHLLLLLFVTSVETMASNLSPSSVDQKKEHLFKVLVIGELATGKTAVVKRYVHNFFSEYYRSTVGVDFALKILQISSDTVVRLQLWDIAGEERFGNMTRVYYRDAVGCLVVFDATRASTFEAVNKWKNDLDAKIQLADGSLLPCILLANKCDLGKEGILGNSQDMEKFCREKGFLRWFETSAKDNINIETSIEYLVAEILKQSNTIKPTDENDIVKLSERQSESNTGYSCCGGKN